jgi:hypothetical protein
MRRETMTWGDIKKAVSDAGVGEDEEIILIQCENDEGDHTFQKTRLGKALKLSENVSGQKARGEAEGCAV